MEQRYTPEEERWNWITHAAGIVLGIAASCFIIFRYFPETGLLGRFSLLLYMAGLLASYISSTAYHACPPSSPWKARLRQCDHAAIYWHIAGSYSPVTLIAMRDSGAWGWTIFGIIWGCAVLGTALSFRKMKKINHLSTVCYVIMGLLILIAFRPLMAAVPLSVVLWIVAEGVMYITGAVFYSIYRKKYLHTVFHIFVLGGTVCHLTAVCLMLETCL